MEPPLKVLKTRNTSLDEIEKIDWKSLSHAYGNAENIPQMLQDFTSDNEGHREGALDYFLCSIYHQGTIYSATPHVCHYLIELLKNNLHKDQLSTLLLLNHCVNAGVDNEYHKAIIKNLQENEEYFQNLLNSPKEAKLAKLITIQLITLSKNSLQIILEEFKNTTDNDTKLIILYKLAINSNELKTEELKSQTINFLEDIFKISSDSFSEILQLFSLLCYINIIDCDLNDDYYDILCDLMNSDDNLGDLEENLIKLKTKSHSMFNCLILETPAVKFFSCLPNEKLNSFYSIFCKIINLYKVDILDYSLTLLKMAFPSPIGDCSFKNLKKSQQIVLRALIDNKSGLYFVKITYCRKFGQKNLVKN